MGFKSPVGLGFLPLILCLFDQHLFTLSLFATDFFPFLFAELLILFGLLLSFLFDFLSISLVCFHLPPDILLDRLKLLRLLLFYLLEFLFDFLIFDDLQCGFAHLF